MTEEWGWTWSPINETCFTGHMGAKVLTTVQLWAPTCSMILAIKLGLYDCILVFKPCNNSSWSRVSIGGAMSAVTSPSCSGLLLTSSSYALQSSHPYLLDILYTSKLGCTMSAHDVLQYLSMGNKIHKWRPRVEHEIDRIQQSLHREQLATVDIDATHAKWHGT